MEITIPADTGEKLMRGEAPGQNLKKPVPFIMVRKQGADVRFTAVLSPQTDLKIQQANSNQVQTTHISGRDFSDNIFTGPRLTVEHRASSAR